MHVCFPLTRSLTHTPADALEQVLLALKVNPENQFGFITDRELALMNSVASVFPNATNHICIWYITKTSSPKPERQLYRIMTMTGTTS